MVPVAKAALLMDSMRVKRLSEHAVLPSRGSAGAAGYDLSAAHDGVVPARGKALIKTDLSIAIPEVRLTSTRRGHFLPCPLPALRFEVHWRTERGELRGGVWRFVYAGDVRAGCSSERIGVEALD